MGVDIEDTMCELPIGQSRTLRTGSKIALLNFGTLLPHALEAAEQLNATLVDMRFVKPLDTQIVDSLCNDHSLLVTIEDGAIIGGAGSAVAEYLAANKKQPGLLQIGLPDTFIMQGTQEEMYQELKMDGAGIVAQIECFLKQS